MKKIIKLITPPILYSFLKRFLVRSVIYKPVWNTVTYEPIKGLWMYFDPKGPWQKKILDGTYDDFLFKKIKSIQPRGKTIIDIGAHIGFHTLYFASIVGEKGKVIAFEPHPKNIERIYMQLDRNERLKTRVKVFELALSDRSGHEEFTMNTDIESGRSSGGYIESADTIWDKETFRNRGFIKHIVNVTTLDNVIGDIKPDIIKIDVEGAESLVLKGAINTIQKYKPIIFLEIHSISNMLNTTIFLSSLGYNIEIIKIEDNSRCFIEAKPK